MDGDGSQAEAAGDCWGGEGPGVAAVDRAVSVRDVAAVGGTLWRVGAAGQRACQAAGGGRAFGTLAVQVFRSRTSRPTWDTPTCRRRWSTCTTSHVTTQPRG